MSTTGYALVNSPLVFDGITLSKSDPPQCLLEFYIQIAGDGHILEITHDIRDQRIDIYVTHIQPEIAEDHQLTNLTKSINLGVLEPDNYSVTFYYRGDVNQEPHDYKAIYSLVLTAHGKDSTLIQPDHSHDWHAWINAMPPGEHVLHVLGNVKVPNENTLVKLVRTHRKNKQAKDLLLTLEMHDSRGSHHKDKEVKVHYSETIEQGHYDKICIRFPNGGHTIIDTLLVSY